ncbi:excalibur calcium-binding domain-containing protein [Sphaerisporangium sp. TRM90804]|uniref:excalibur calcium-binding domain-containing protein n=1 Tax=Sphaerisporangium sp. TRM90804 TaxID=3031113 RepID=UPI002446AFA5|nr:excalibur calcium-binding domain-containing protein [Sphaerisporangium sp. TRM90804]MDH2424659.1 excalibur calcium-binding domain-containing protein [Sphaerisporangium sp. TRM90804]
MPGHPPADDHADRPAETDHAAMPGPGTAAARSGGRSPFERPETAPPSGSPPDPGEPPAAGGPPGPGEPPAGPGGPSGPPPGPGAPGGPPSGPGAPPRAARSTTIALIAALAVVVLVTGVLGTIAVLMTRQPDVPLGAAPPRRLATAIHFAPVTGTRPAPCPGAEAVLDDAGTTCYQVAPGVTVTSVLKVEAVADTGGEYAVRVVLAPESRQRLEDLTRDALNQLLAVVVDDKVVAAPRVAQPITQDSLSITGLDEQQADALVSRLLGTPGPVPGTDGAVPSASPSAAASTCPPGTGTAPPGGTGGVTSPGGPITSPGGTAPPGTPTCSPTTAPTGAPGSTQSPAGGGPAPLTPPDGAGTGGAGGTGVGGAGTTPSPQASASPRASANVPVNQRSEAPRSAATRSPDPRYRTCREANAAGRGPYTEGVHPEYAWYTDGDRDGVACERGDLG